MRQSAERVPLPPRCNSPSSGMRQPFSDAVLDLIRMYEVGLGREAKGRLLARRPMAILGVMNGKLPFCAFSDRRSTRLSIASRRLTTRALGAGEGIRRTSRSP